MAPRKWILPAVVVLAALLGTVITRSLQGPSIRTVDEASLREYAGVYQWGPNAFVYLQIWSELSGTNQLSAFDESGEVRTCIRRNQIVSSRDPAPRFRTRSSRESSFNAVPAARLSRSPGRATTRPPGRRGG
jgi:hypothetical protein